MVMVAVALPPLLFA
jgi:hypothetical protein